LVDSLFWWGGGGGSNFFFFIFFFPKGILPPLLLKKVRASFPARFFFFSFSVLDAQFFFPAENMIQIWTLSPPPSPNRRLSFFFLRKCLVLASKQIFFSFFSTSEITPFPSPSFFLKKKKQKQKFTYPLSPLFSISLLILRCCFSLFLPGPEATLVLFLFLLDRLSRVWGSSRFFFFLC